jgi:hypothetical protein
MAGVGQAYGADPVGAQAADTVTSTQKPSSQQVFLAKSQIGMPQVWLGVVPTHGARNRES